MSIPEFLRGTWVYCEHKNQYDHRHTVWLYSRSCQMNQIKYIFIRRCTDPDSEGRRKAHRSANGLENKKRWLRIFFTSQGEERAWLWVICKWKCNRAMILWLTTQLSNILCAQAFCITATCDDPSNCMGLRIVKTMRPSIASFWPPKWEIWDCSRTSDSKALFLKSEEYF